MLTESGVSLPSTPPSAVPYKDAKSVTGFWIPARSATSARHSSLNTSPASTSLSAYECQGTPSAMPASITSFRNGG